MMNHQNPNPKLPRVQLDPPTGPPALRPVTAVAALRPTALHHHEDPAGRGHAIMAVLAFGGLVILTLGGALAVALLQP